MTTLDLNFFRGEDSFKKYVGYSLLAHVFLVLVFTIKTAFFSGEPIQYEAAIKVDLVALPDKLNPQEKIALENSDQRTKTETPPTATVPVKTLEKDLKKPVDKEAINLDKTKSKTSAAMEKLKQLSALEKIENDIKEENKNKSLEKLKQIKGNVLSAGSELKGIARLQHDNYIAVVERHIRQNWALPEWLAKKNLSAQVRVRFDERGNIISNDISRSSGNASFDEVVLATVKKSSPVPLPPEKFVWILNSEGILLGFPE